jgi:cell division protein FtsX
MKVATGEFDKIVENENLLESISALLRWIRPVRFIKLMVFGVCVIGNTPNTILLWVANRRHRI